MLASVSRLFERFWNVFEDQQDIDERTCVVEEVAVDAEPATAAWIAPQVERDVHLDAIDLRNNLCEYVVIHAFHAAAAALENVYPQ
jgi:hypothetical protein